MFFLAGCQGSSGDAPESSIDPQFLESARASDVSEEQIAILEDGQVTFEEYQVAVGRSLACIRDAGIEVIGDSVTDAHGFPEINYSFAVSSSGRSDDQTLAIADDCMAMHSFWVEAAYRTAPGAVEARDSQFEPYRESIIQCIRDNGEDIPDDAGRLEVMGAVVELHAAAGVQCADEAGYRE